MDQCDRAGALDRREVMEYADANREVHLACRLILLRQSKLPALHSVQRPARFQRGSGNVNPQHGRFRILAGQNLVARARAATEVEHALGRLIEFAQAPGQPAHATLGE